MAEVTTIGIGIETPGAEASRRALEGVTKAADLLTVAAQTMIASQEALQRSMLRTAEASEHTAEATHKMTSAFTKGEVLGEKIGETINKVGELALKFVELGLSVGRFMDLAYKTGGDPAGFANLQTAADLAGTSVDHIATSMTRLTQMLNSTEGRSSRAHEALKNLGIDLQAFTNLRADEQMRVLSSSFNQFADDTMKVANAQALWGRGGAEQLILMKKMTEAGEPLNLLTNEQIKLADHQEVAMKKVLSEWKQYTQFIATGVLEPMESVVKALKAQVTGMDEFDKGTNKLEHAKHAVESFAYSVARVLTYPITAFESLQAGFARVMLSVDHVVNKTELMAQKNTFIRSRGMALGTQADIDKLKAFDDAITGLGEDYDKAAADIAGRPGIGESIRAAVNAAESGAHALEATWGSEGRLRQKKSLGGLSGEDEKARKAREKLIDEVDRGIDKLIEESLALDTLTQHAFNATNEEDQLAKALASVHTLLEQADKIGQAEGENDRIAITTQAEIIAQKRVQSALIKEDNEDRIKSNRISASTVMHLENEVGAIREKSQALQDLNDSYGSFDDASKKLIEGRQLEKAASYEATAQFLLEHFDVDATAEAYLQLAASIRKLVSEEQRRRDLIEGDRKDMSRGVHNAFQQFIDDASNLGTAMETVTTKSIKGVEDALVDMVMKGKANWRSLIDSMISEFMRLMFIKPMMASLMKGNLFTSIGGAVSGFGTGASFGSLDQGAFLATGGPAQAGRSYVVGERGPELFTPSTSGTVTPNDKLGGKTINVTIAPTIRIDARSDAGQVAGLVQAAISNSQRQMMEELHAQGAL